jgi:sigma-B regulation protein RsbU (phosphoserine phosphatase)
MISRSGLGIFLPVLILLLTVAVISEALINGLAEQGRRETIETVRTRLRRLLVRVDSAAFVKTQLLSLDRPGIRTGSAKLLERKLGIIRKRGLEVFFYRFQASGEFLDHFPQRVPHLWLMKGLYKGVISTDPTQIERHRKNLEKKLSFAFGEGKDLGFFQTGIGRPVEVFSAGDTGALLIKFDSKGGLIAYCPKIPNEYQIFQRLSPKGIARGLIATGIGRSSEPEFFHHDLRPDLSARDAFLDLRRRRATQGVVGDKWWFFQEAASGVMVYGVVSPPDARFFSPRFLTRLMLPLSLPILWLFFSGGAIAATRLRSLLLGLFLVSGFIPTLAVAVGSLDLVRVYRHIIGSRMEAVQNQVIEGIVNDFNAFLDTNGSYLKRLFLTLAPGKKAGDHQQLLNTLRQRQLLHSIQIRDAGGNLCFSNVPPLPFGRETFLRSFSRKAVSLLASKRLKEQPYKGNVLTDKFVTAPDMGFVILLGKPGKLQSITVGDRQELFFFSILPEKGGSAAFVEVRLPLAQGVKAYLRRAAGRRMNFSDTAIRLYAFDPADLNWTISPPISLQQELRRLSMESLVIGQPRSAWITRPGGRRGGYAVCIPCPGLADFCLIAFCPDDRLNAGITATQRALLIGGAIFLLVASLLWRVISHSLLAPLKDLEAGVAALASRDFSVRLPVTGHDEMAVLFQAFNEMMADSRDLQVAKRVQEGLVPHSFSAPPGYSIFGMILTAADLGGDCLDSFLLPDGRLVFLVGDIAGHGIGSALMMAFTRAVTFHWSTGKCLTTTSLAADLDATLRRRRGAKSFLGAIIGILDPQSHHIELNVLGHPYPLLITRNGELSPTAGEPGFPLGIGSKRKSFPAQKIDLGPGDSLFCMTDGFIEALDTSGKQVGYEKSADILLSTRGEDAETWINAVMAQHSAWCERKPDDDITLFCLIRKPQAVEPFPSPLLNPPLIDTTGGTHGH